MSKLAVVAGLAVSVALASCRRPPAPGAGEPRSASVAHRDPVTGRFGPPPVGTAPAPSSARATIPAAPLAEEAAAGGGFMIRLDRRFDSRMTASVDAAGRRTTTCREQAGAEGR
jgi:hypothetical protein